MQPFLEKDSYFISDLGGETQTQVDGLPLGRYAVWRSNGEQLQMLEVGGELSPLLEKYGLRPEQVGRVGAG